LDLGPPDSFKLQGFLDRFFRRKSGSQALRPLPRVRELAGREHAGEEALAERLERRRDPADLHESDTDAQRHHAHCARTRIAVSHAAAQSSNVAEGSNGFLLLTARAAFKMNVFAPCEIVS